MAYEQVGIAASWMFASCACAGVSPGEYSGANVAIHIDGGWGYSLTGATVASRTMSLTGAANSAVHTSSEGGGLFQCFSEGCVPDPDPVILEPQCFSGTPPFSIDLDTSDVPDPYGCSGARAYVTGAFNNDSGSFNFGGQGGIDAAWRHYPACTEDENYWNLCVKDDSARWCKGGAATFTTTGEGTLRMYGFLTLSASANGANADGCVNYGRPRITATKIGRSRYDLTVIQPNNVALTLPLVVEVIATGDSHGPATIAWIVSPSTVVFPTTSLVTATTWTVTTPDACDGVSQSCSGEWSLGALGAEFAIDIQLGHWGASSASPETWSVALAASNDIESVPVGDVAGGGDPLGCALGGTCDPVGSFPDGNRDWNDFRALQFARGKDEYVNNCGFLPQIDLNGNHIDDDSEVDYFLCDLMVDVNRDGFIDFFDYDDFVAAFETGTDCLADANGDGFLDFFDYDLFVASFEGINLHPCEDFVEVPVPDCCD